MKRIVVKVSGKFIDVTPVQRKDKLVNVLQLLTANADNVKEIVPISIRDANDLKAVAGIPPMADVVCDIELSTFKEEMYATYVGIKKVG